MNAEPTPEDFARDLLADLAYLAQFEPTARRNSPAWVRGWPAAVRRALHAEAEAARLRNLLDEFVARESV